MFVSSTSLPHVLVLRALLLGRCVWTGSPQPWNITPQERTVAAAWRGSGADAAPALDAMRKQGQACRGERPQGKGTHAGVRFAQRAAKPARRPSRQLRQALRPERAAQAGRTPGVLEPTAARAGRQRAHAAGHISQGVTTGCGLAGLAAALMALGVLRRLSRLGCRLNHCYRNWSGAAGSRSANRLICRWFATGRAGQPEPRQQPPQLALLLRCLPPACPLNNRGN